MKSLTIDQTKAMLISVADKIIESKPMLTEVDSKIGDGDHGIGMEGGFKKAKKKLLETAEFKDVNDIFRTVGMTMMNSMGGASGVIFGTTFSGGSKKVDSAIELNGEMITQLFRASLNEVKKVGKAEVGDKTMVDAFEPAVIAMEQSDKNDLSVLLAQAEQAALQGVENTKKYTAKFGRAKSLLDRSIGFQDAGATSIWLIFKSMREFVGK